MRIADGAAHHKGALLEGFVLANFAFLVLDVFLAHSVNAFRHWAEWIPFVFSIAATALLVPALPSAGRTHPKTYAHRIGLVVGCGSIALGITGVAYHLESQFFTQWTLRSLVYTAPFAAPLAYAGLGFLLLVNRMVPRETDEWNGWVVFFALGGFLGIFVLALCDHAQNGFFYASEWWPVAASALAGGFLSVALVDRRAAFLRICLGVLGLQAVIGLLGFYFHVAADISGLSASLFENFVHGARRPSRRCCSSTSGSWRRLGCVLLLPSRVRVAEVRPDAPHVEDRVGRRRRRAGRGNRDRAALPPLVHPGGH